jgi:hypothetical protein
MNKNQKWSALKLAVLLGTVSVLFTGCFIWRDNDQDYNDQYHHEDKDHHDQDHNDDQEHHE